MCHAAEYIRATSPVAIPATGAWMDPSADESNGFTTSGGAPTFGRYRATNACVNWTTTNAGNSGTYVMPDGGMSRTGSCSVGRPVACCF